MDSAVNVNDTVEPIATDTTVATETAVEYKVPEKYMRDGQPDYQAMTKGYVELEKKLGQKNPQAPSDISEYESGYSNPDNINEDRLNDLRSYAKELGLSKDQFKGMTTRFEQEVGYVLDELMPNAESAMEVLVGEWGNDYASNLSSAMSAFKAYAPEGTNINSVGFNDPEVLKLLAAIGADMGEDKKAKSSSSETGTSTIDETEVLDLMKRPDYYTNPDIQKKVKEFYNRKYPG